MIPCSFLLNLRLLQNKPTLFNTEACLLAPQAYVSGVTEQADALQHGGVLAGNLDLCIWGFATKCPLILVPQ